MLAITLAIRPTWEKNATLAVTRTDRRAPTMAVIVSTRVPTKNSCEERPIRRGAIDVDSQYMGMFVACPRARRGMSHARKAQGPLRRDRWWIHTA